jgi:thiamine-monophosphate kinase
VVGHIRRSIPSAVCSFLRVGIGDDAAILRARGDREVVITCDQFIEGVHFLDALHAPDVVGYKALARAASDIAAMGAGPTVFLLSLAIPGLRAGKWLTEMTGGMARAAQRFGIRLAGGDTAQSPNGVTISITVLGQVAKGRAVRRSGARNGDIIFVAGELGAAQLGLDLLKRGVCGRTDARRNDCGPWQQFLTAHNYPVPCIKLGEWLAGRELVSAMMDVSDGLSTDLTRLCKASGVGARIAEGALPYVALPSASASRSDDYGGAGAAGWTGERGKSNSSRNLDAHAFDVRELALHGGEDYGLLFTVRKKLAARIPQSFEGTRITRIGEIVRGRGVKLVSAEGIESPLVPRGWDHFRERDTPSRQQPRPRRPKRK